MKTTTLILAALTLSVSAMANDSANKPLLPAGKSGARASKPTALVVATLDTAASTAAWTGKIVAGPHNGNVSFKEGTFNFKKYKLVGGSVTIDLNTITNEDVKDADYKKKLVEHLKSEDFFNVAKHPEATYKITSLSEVYNIIAGQPNLQAKGLLTMHGVTKPIKTMLIYTPTETGFTAKGKLIIDRTQFGLKYNSKKNKLIDIKALGDKLIDDNFEVDLNLVAKK